MDWINGFFGTQLSDGVQLALLFGGLIVVLLLVFWLFRKIFGGPGTRHSRSRQPRLSITEIAAVDDKRRLILVRRDNVEHLVMTGGPSDLVVEQNIVRIAPVPAPMAASPTQAQIPLPAGTPVPAQPPAPAAHLAVRQHASEPARTEPVNSGLFSTSRDQASAPALDKPAASQSLQGAALAGAGALAVSAGEFVSSAAETATKSASETADTISASSRTALDSLSGNLDISPESPATQTTPHQEATGTDTGLTDVLEVALALDEPAASSPAPEVTGDQTPKNESNNTEDEMQRLLKELAAGN